MAFDIVRAAALLSVAHNKEITLSMINGSDHLYLEGLCLIEEERDRLESERKARREAKNLRWQHNKAAKRDLNRALSKGGSRN